MRAFRITAFLAAAVCLCGAVSCSGSKLSSSGGDTAETTAPAAIEAPTGFATLDDVIAYVQKAESSDEPFSFGKTGEKLTPAEGSDEADLGEYYLSPDGVKLYFDPEKFPAELVLTLEEYFKAYANADYESYTRCLYPSYIEEMNKFLKNTPEFGYDLKTSFSKQCFNLQSAKKGGFAVTRIRLEYSDRDPKAFFDYPSNSFGKDYYAEVSSEVDKFYDADFFVIVVGEDGTETKLVSEYEIVFAEKDGRYYTFG